MNFNIITLFPNMIESYLAEGVIGRAKAIKVNVINPRGFTDDRHHTVDDKPFGGGDGMLMKIEPLKRSLESLKQKGRVVYLSPHGPVWDNNKAQTWARDLAAVTLICGRYAGVDQRFINQYCDEQISLGDFIMSGGELAALAIVDSIARFIPGVLGNKLSSEEESFQSKGLLECPQYTRPGRFDGVSVPSVLLSGDHKKIVLFKNNISVVLTCCLKPELIKNQIPEDKLTQAFIAIEGLPDDELQALGLKRDQITLAKERFLYGQK